MTEHHQATTELWERSAQARELAIAYGVIAEDAPLADDDSDSQPMDDLTGIELDASGDLTAYRTCDAIGSFSGWTALPAHIDAPYPGDDLADIVLALAEHIGASIDGGEITTDSDFATWQV